MSGPMPAETARRTLGGVLQICWAEGYFAETR
jgi:hypothetical protein